MDLGETQRLRRDIERSLSGAFDPADVLPRLARLARMVVPKSDDAVFANQMLAELLVEHDPWRAALYVRRALAVRDEDDRLWAILALSHTLLGNFRVAESCYKRALVRSPANASYAHNLGHLLDVALGRSADALPWLLAAYEARRQSSEVVASYVHALARAGKIEDARTVLTDATTRLASNELDALHRWLDRGAPSRPRRTERPRAATTTPRRLARVLERGLQHLPLDEGQRERAFALAKDALQPEATTPLVKVAPAEIAGLAAAVAYAIVYIDHLPLSQAEVAAPFRVGVANLRGRFAELRAKLDLIRGDVRYATTRR